jgi:hypothetical protein
MSSPDEAFGVQVGDRIRLVRMGSDPAPMSPGATGTVVHLCALEGFEQIGVDWDGRRGLHLIPGSDEWETIDDT